MKFSFPSQISLFLNSLSKDYVNTLFYARSFIFWLKNKKTQLDFDAPMSVPIVFIPIFYIIFISKSMFSYTKFSKLSISNFKIFKIYKSF